MGIVLAYLCGTLILMLAVCVWDDYERRAVWTCALVLAWPIVVLGTLMAIVIGMLMAIVYAMFFKEE